MRSYSAATKRLKSIYDSNVDHRSTLYCGCAYDEGKNVDFRECGYTPKRETNRSHRVEWEHMVPASRFGNFRTCWTRGGERCSSRGRRCCEKKGVDPDFYAMVSDLHNLAPTIGEVNLRRLHHPYGETIETDDYGGCDFDLVNDVVEPAPSVRGNVARAWLYMNSTFRMPLTESEREMFLAWHWADPPSVWEERRNTAIESVQGNRNPWIDSVEPNLGDGR